MTGSLISVGKLGKPHGLSGAFRFLLHRELKNKKKTPKYFLLKKGSNPAPYFIKQIEWNGFNEGFINFEEVTTPEQAKQLAGTELLMYENEVNTLFRKDADDLSYLNNFKVIDQAFGYIGTVSEMIESPGQTLLSIAEKNIMIPLVDDFIVEINKRKKEILLDLPEGLLDL